MLSKLDFLFGDEIEKEEALSKAQGADEIEGFRAQLEKGEILVRDKQGNIGAIPEAEFDTKLYTKL